MLAAIQSGEEEAPQSRPHLGQVIARRVLAERRVEIRPIWDESVFALLDDLLGTLTERERELICERFGISVTKTRTLKQIASDWNLTDESIRQIEAKAIGKLHTEAVKRQLGVLRDTVGNALQRELAQRKTKEEALKLGDLPKIELYLRRADELGFSIRTTNCLANQDIIFVGELIQLTEPQLLRTKNFGRKSLMEIKEVLEDLDPTLRLCTKVSDDIKALLDKRRQELFA